MEVISKSTLDFLSLLALNNNRDWFEANKSLYATAQQNVIGFINELLVKMNEHDEIENLTGKKCLFRIYKDLRFSKDKSPYNARFAFGLKRATKLKRGGYFMQIKPGESYLACGFFAPNAEDLFSVRKDIEINALEWKEVLGDIEILHNFGQLQGNKIATYPRGFDKNHADIDLIRHKQFIFRKNFTDAELCSPDFLMHINDIYKSIRPFFDLMSEILTTDANGETII